MAKDTKEQWVYYLIGIIAFTLLYSWLSKRKNPESPFNFGNPMFSDPSGNVIVYNLENISQAPQEVNLFERVGTTNPNVKIDPSKANFAEEIKTNPVQIDKVKINSQNEAQVETPVQVICSRATGTTGSYVITPQISPTQFQTKVVEVRPKGLILDGTCSVRYRIAPNTKVTLLFNFSPARKVVAQNQPAATTQQGDAYAAPSQTQILPKKQNIWMIIAFVVIALFALSPKSNSA